MKDIIDTVIQSCIEKHQRMEVVARYIRMKYRIRIDKEVIEHRARSLSNSGDAQLAA